MNPFQRLRQAIDKVDLNYKFPQSSQHGSQNSAHSHNIPIKTEQLLPNTTNQMIAKLWDDKQTQYIRQINNLSSKVQTLTKNMKLVEVQNQELLQDICKLEKQNEKLKNSLQNQKGQEKTSDDKERKYKQQIYRLNKTLEQLYSELNSQRTVKKQISNQKTKKQEQSKYNIEKLLRSNEQLVQKIKILKEQAEQRNKMLEFNFRRNSEQKSELKRQLQIAKQKLANQKGENKQELQQFKSLYYEAKSHLQLQQHKRQSHQATIKKLQKQIQVQKVQNKQLEQELARNMLEKNNLEMHTEKLKLQIDQISALLEYEKTNKKVKVIEVRNQALELELDMYKRQCKQLLHERAVMSSLNSSKREDLNYRTIMEDQRINYQQI